MSSYWWHFIHSLHCRFSFWLFPVQSGMKFRQNDPIFPHDQWILKQQFRTVSRERLMISGSKFLTRHDDVIKWKRFPRYWPFVRGIHRSPVNSPHKGQWRGALIFSLICLNKRLSKQSWGWWFETLSCPLWRHRNGLMHVYITVWINRLFLICHRYVCFPQCV